MTGNSGEDETVMCGSIDSNMSTCQRPGCRSFGTGTFANGMLRSGCVLPTCRGGGAHVKEGKNKECGCKGCVEKEQNEEGDFLVFLNSGDEAGDEESEEEQDEGRHRFDWRHHQEPQAHREASEAR